MRVEYQEIESQTKTQKEVVLETKTPDSNFEVAMVSPYGFYTNPKGEVALVWKNGESMIGMPLQKYVKLEEGDVMVTDGKSKLHLQQQDGKIVITGDTVFENGVTIKGDLEVEGNVKVKGDISGDKNVEAKGDMKSKNMEAQAQIKGVNIEASGDVKAGPNKVSSANHTHMYTDTTGVGPAVQSVTLAPLP